jgi:hypothetical protein
MAAKILALFALLTLSVSAATAVSFPQYNPLLIAFKVNNPYSQYNLPHVTPCFPKRIEFYGFIYLNKYLFVAFHVDTYFPLYCEVFLYFITWVEVVKIQISLQIIKRFEKEKDFPSSYLAMGWNPAGIWVQPSRHLLSPPLFYFLRGPTSAQLPQHAWPVSQPNEASSASTQPAPARPMPSILPAMMKQSPSSSLRRRWGKSPISIILDGNGTES